MGIEVTVKQTLLGLVIEELGYYYVFHGRLNGWCTFNICKKGSEIDLSLLLKEYEPPYWSKILRFVENYFSINIPEDYYEQIRRSSKQRQAETKPSSDTKEKSFFNEYNAIKASNKYIASEFIQLLGLYRAKKVNKSNLNLDQLYYPEQMYNYLRNHHWKEGFPREFVKEWVLMKLTNYSLSEDDQSDFETLFEKLGIPLTYFVRNPNQNQLVNISITQAKSLNFQSNENHIPSIQDFALFKKWILEKLEDIEELIKN